jgi:curved DNA-binding protein CbpA
MDKVLIENKYYDPYFILSVTQSDSLKHITKAFRAKAKVLHPDKFKNKKDVDMNKVYKHFNILLECYEFILDKHKNLQLKSERDDSYIEPLQNQEQDQTHQENLDYGYGEIERLQTLEEYDENKPKQTKIFNGKFNKNQFNKVFEYNELEYTKEKNPKDLEVQLELVHKTSDGFFAYNSNDWGDCSLVKSFNGLMILGDDLGQTGKGYSSSGYVDYKKSISAPLNPNKEIRVPKDFKTKDKYEFKSKTIKTILNERQQFQHSYESFDNEEHKLLEKKKSELKQKIKDDEDFVKKYSSSIFTQRLIEQAKNKKLNTSKDYIHDINDHLSYDENIRKNKK